MQNSRAIIALSALAIALLACIGTYYVNVNSTTTVTVRATLRQGDLPPKDWILLVPTGSGIDAYTHRAVFCRVKSFDSVNGTVTVSIDWQKRDQLSQSVLYEIQVGGKYVEETAVSYTHLTLPTKA